MTRSEHNIHFTAFHHALLFSCISKSVLDSIKTEQGQALIRSGVRRYGEQRGHRMALRALKNNHSLTMENYLAYGEWTVEKKEMEFKFAQKNPHARMIVSKCPWNQAWQTQGLLEYGKYFCMEIDQALVRGFNPDLEIQVNSTQTQGHDTCDFVFKQARLSIFRLICLLYKKKIHPGKKAVMPWEYHAGHLYKTMKETITKALGTQADLIMAQALAAFARQFSNAHAACIKTYEDVDFNILPD
ncbi:MAG: L-2-amino-thiazoline-4-carboxylic acid hydrolase [Desulfobacter sp.]|nr:L-2-amino-thiazoline-4-carboxylic acid hydrolase [Desulfobacter sp.]WDP86399.1 MAG: L-2-amino-thiazoline-4-carboxylic acid hydrolase [Desulfobacter sp.]